MKQSTKMIKNKNKLYMLGKMLGLDYSDIDKIITVKSSLVSSNSDSEMISSHVDMYKGNGWYGTVSIRDFR